MRQPADIRRVFAFARKADLTAVAEHDLVRLRGAVGAYPKGTIGTVVAIWKANELYEVEFDHPAAVVTVPAAAIDPLPRGS